MSRRATIALLLALGGCDRPAADDRGTPGSPLRVDLSLTDLGRQLAADTGPWGGIPLQIKETTNGGDASYHSELKVGDAQKLVVVPSRGDPVELTGQTLHADYFHMGRLLIVREGEGPGATYHHFVEPVRWSTAAR